MALNVVFVLIQTVDTIPPLILPGREVLMAKDISLVHQIVVFLVGALMEALDHLTREKATLAVRTKVDLTKAETIKDKAILMAHTRVDLLGMETVRAGQEAQMLLPTLTLKVLPSRLINHLGDLRKLILLPLLLLMLLHRPIPQLGDLKHRLILPHLRLPTPRQLAVPDKRRLMHLLKHPLLL